MKSNDKQYTIYIRSTDQHIPVSKETFDSFYKDINVYRRRMQRNGECACPQNKRLFCDTDCDNCPFRVTPDTLSLDHTVSDKDGNEVSWLESLPDFTSIPENIVTEAAEMQRLYTRLAELMPEAVEIGRLRLKGLTDTAIAKEIGIVNTTFLSRLKKVKKTLAEEFPEFF